MRIRNFIDLKSLLLENKTITQTIFKNTFWQAVGVCIDRLLRLILLIYAARILGATEYGKFTFALAFISLFIVFYDFGLPMIITREFSREKNKEDLRSILSLKVLLSLGTFILIFLSSFFITSDPGIQKIILILAFFTLVNGFITVFHSLFQAFQRMEYRAWTEIILAILITVTGLFVLFRFPSILNLSYAYFVSSLGGLFVILAFFHFKFFHLNIAWQKSIWKKFLTMSWPLALVSLFGVIYTYIDSVMMGYLDMMTETGWYNAAYKIIHVTIIPASLISKSFFPVLSKFFNESKERLQKAWDKQMESMILLAVPLMVGGIVLAPRIIYSFYSSTFAPSILAFQILMLTVGIIFLYRPFYDVMISSNNQKKVFGITVFGAIANIILNLILIPKYSLYGAAVATLLTYIFILPMYFRFTVKLTSISPFRLKFFFTSILAIFSSVLMYFMIIQPSIYSLNIFFSSIIGIMTYFAAFFGLKYVFKSIHLGR